MLQVELKKVYIFILMGFDEVKLSDKIIDNYHLDIDKFGFYEVWEKYLFIIKNEPQTFVNRYFPLEFIGFMYENGYLYSKSWDNKLSQSQFTPNDVSQIVAELIVDRDIKTVADVCCGDGNLIINILAEIKKIDIHLLNNLRDKIFLYDNDPLALKVAAARIKSLFFINIPEINLILGDFLSEDIKLPPYTYAICNPPLDNKGYNKDYFLFFFDKILKSASKFVFIAPQTIIDEYKFSSFRKKLMSNSFGDIFCFDNVPDALYPIEKGNFGVKTCIINGECDFSHRGYRLTHLIRFNRKERSKVLTTDYLLSCLGTIRQDLVRPLKLHKKAEDFVVSCYQEDETLASLCSENKNEFCLSVINSGRYYLAACKHEIKRNGAFKIYAKDQHSFIILYLLLNSSYCYLFFRSIGNGSILSKKELLSYPCPKIVLTDELQTLVSFMINQENKLIKAKFIQGELQEHLKFPEIYCEFLDNLLFEKNFKFLHKNYEISDNNN